MVSCDSQRVPTGRAKIAVVALALAVGFAGSAAAQPVVHPAAKKHKKKVKVVFFKARVISDGFLTPGQSETVAVTHMPRKTRFEMAIEPPPTTLQCGQFFFCDIAPVTPAPLSPPFRTNGRGQALATFIVPPTYNIATDPFDPSTRHPVAWANGQRIHIDVQGVKRLPHKRKLGFGFGRAAIQTS
jgi:hypothetical protein